MNELYVLIITQTVMLISGLLGVGLFVVKSSAETRAAAAQLKNEDRGVELKMQNMVLAQASKDASARDSLQNQLSATQAKMIGMLEQQHSLEKIIQNGRAESDRHLVENKRLTESIKEQNRQHEDQIRKYDSSLRGYTKENSRLSKEVADLKNEISQLKDRVKSLEDQVHGRDVLIEQLESERDALKVERDTLRDRVDSLESERDRLRGELDSLRTELDVIDISVKKLETLSHVAPVVDEPDVLAEKEAV